jgi:phosphoribosylformylglycinamidine cyclo-ligase
MWVIIKPYCNIMHADGAGTKSSLLIFTGRNRRHLCLKKGIAQDTIVI